MRDEGGGSDSGAEPPNEPRMSHAAFADDPVRPDEDTLGRRMFGETAANLLDRVATQSPSAVLGLIGPWGSGKTSILGFLEKELTDEWTSVSFSPWALSNLNDLVREFFATLGAAFPGSRGKNVRERLGHYAERIIPFAHLVPAPDFASTLQGLQTILVGDTSLEAKRRELAKAIEDASQRVVVVIDDLDRLHPDELLLVFKLVRLVGRLPGVFYVLSFDETSLVDVLIQTDVARGNRQRALRFIEKIVQIRVDIPPLHFGQITELVDGALNLILTTHRVEVEAEDWQDFAGVFEDHIRPHLTEPRSVKRYLAQADAYWTLVAGEVNFVDFLLLTFVRTFYPGVYRMLPRRKADLVIPRPFFLSEEPDAGTVVEEWRDLLRENDLHREDIEDIVHVLGQLFAPLRTAMNAFGGGAASPDELYRRKKVGSADYFDRYFQFGVPSSDVPDQLVEAAVRDIAIRKPGEAREALFPYLSTRGDQVINKMMAAALAPSPAEASEIFYFVSDYLSR